MRNPIKPFSTRMDKKTIDDINTKVRYYAKIHPEADPRDIFSIILKDILHDFGGGDPDTTDAQLKKYFNEKIDNLAERARNDYERYHRTSYDYFTFVWPDDEIEDVIEKGYELDLDIFYEIFEEDILASTLPPGKNITIIILKKSGMLTPIRYFRHRTISYHSLEKDDISSFPIP